MYSTCTLILNHELLYTVVGEILQHANSIKSMFLLTYTNTNSLYKNTKHTLNASCMHQVMLKQSRIFMYHSVDLHSGKFLLL